MILVKTWMKKWKQCTITIKKKIQRLLEDDMKRINEIDKERNTERCL